MKKNISKRMRFVSIALAMYFAMTTFVSSSGAGYIGQPIEDGGAVQSSSLSCPWAGHSGTVSVLGNEYLCYSPFTGYSPGCVWVEQTLSLACKEWRYCGTFFTTNALFVRTIRSHGPWNYGTAGRYCDPYATPKGCGYWQPPGTW